MARHANLREPRRGESGEATEDAARTRSASRAARRIPDEGASKREKRKRWDRTPGRSLDVAREKWTCWRYRVLWSWHNREARRLHRASPAPLGSAQQRVLADLRRCGIARASFEEICGDGAPFAALRDEALVWSDSETVAHAERAYREAVRSKPRFKGFLASLHDKGATIAWEDPWLQAGIHRSLLALAEHYFGLLPRLHHANLWKSFPLAHPGPLVGPQAWHRDPADLSVLKAFLYFSDVTDDAGPLEYVPYSRPGERFGHLWRPAIPLRGAHPPALDFEREIPIGERVRCCHPAGTVVLVDTAGFHRGGRAVGRARLVGTWAYSSQASLWPRKFRVRGLGDRPLSLAVHYALLAGRAPQPASEPDRAPHAERGGRA